MTITILRLIAFLISGFGYAHFVSRKLRVTAEFTPAFVVCLQTTILCLAGMMRILLPAAIALHGAGFALFAIALPRDRKKLLTDALRPASLFLLLATGILFAVLYGQKFIDYDNFTHWGTTVRNMLETNRFPNSSDQLIKFQDYPPASAAYIYFFSILVGSGEHIWMLAQNFMMICFIAPLFVHVRKYKLPAIAAMLLFANFLLCYNITVTNLLVDTLLPLQAMAALFFIRHECFEKQNPISLFWSIPFLCTTVQIKNSGVFFIAVACALILYCAWKNKRLTLSSVIVCAAPLVMMMLWKLHCSISFDAAEASKHAMTLKNYAKVFGDKTLSQMLSICLNASLESVRGISLYLTAGMLGLLGLISFALDRQSIRRWLNMAAVIGCLYGAYMLGIILMYIFSMPYGESRYLASFERYRKTILIAIYYIMAVYTLKLFSRSAFNPMSILSASAVLAVLIITYTATFQPIAAISERYGSVRPWLESVIERYSLPSDSTYSICIPKYDSGYTKYLSRYLLQTADVNIGVVESEEVMDLVNSDYLIIGDTENPIIKQWVSENYPDQAGEEVISLALSPDALN